MKKMSLENLFKKSKTSGGKKSKMLIFLLIFIVAAGAFYWWGYPLLFPENTVVQTPVVSVAIATPSLTTVTPKTEVEPIIKEKTEFEIEVEKRKQGYEEKIFVYEPYEPPSSRNPFQKLSTSYFSEETPEKEEGEVVSILRLPKPELPPGTKLSGIINSKDNKVAIILINEETYIANLYDIISERYVIKEIKNDEVIIDYNGYFFSIKIGGEGNLND